MLSIILSLFFSIAQQVLPNPFVSDECERLPQSRRKQSACSHFKLFQKGIKTVTLYTRWLRSQRHWQATGMHILTGGKVKELVFYGLRWCFSIIQEPEQPPQHNKSIPRGKDKEKTPTLCSHKLSNITHFAASPPVCVCECMHVYLISLGSLPFYHYHCQIACSWRS